MAVQAAAEAARMPVGMRVLGEDERQEMLDALSRSNQQIQAQLLGMPLVLETPSQVPRDPAVAHPVAACRACALTRMLCASALHAVMALIAGWGDSMSPAPPVGIGTDFTS